MGCLYLNDGVILQLCLTVVKIKTRYILCTDLLIYHWHPPLS